IAFRLDGAPGVMVGDVYCAPEVARLAARRFGATIKDELRRLVVHGVLHLLGYDHPEGEGRTQGSMWQRQERYLRRFARLAR
ncbi:MAG: rRNA maturation RNase YbeY, partial [Gemmatimonadales bacterium]|nr:rRNA maturation RNase YbeY [Gemmatimonadales bacterium]